MIKNLRELLENQFILVKQMNENKLFNLSFKKLVNQSSQNNLCYLLSDVCHAGFDTLSNWAKRVGTAHRRFPSS